MRNATSKISATINYIETHLNEKLDLKTVANAMHYSKYHLHRLFTNTVGLTIHDYIQRRQLTEAAKLLVFSNKSILELSLLAGYKSQQAFTSAFKAMYKQPPSQFRDMGQFYPLQLKFILQDYPTKLNDMEKVSISFANEQDLPLWMDLVQLVLDGFPGFIKDDYVKVLKKCIAERRALILKDKFVAIGIMIFSYETQSIDFFGVHPQYRNQGIAKAFLYKITNKLLINREISLTTFREGDAADNGSRMILKRLGFAESELLVEFGYPTQRLILPINARRHFVNG